MRTDSAGRAPIYIALGTLASRVLGLLRDALTARYFPPEIRDAFVIAFRLPNFFRRVLGEGAFSASFVPEIAALRATQSEADAQKAAAAAFAGLMAIAGAMSLLGILGMGPILRVVLSGNAFQEIPGKLELTVYLAQIMFGFLALACLYAYLMAAMHAVGRFALAAAAPVLFNGAMVATAFIAPGVAVRTLQIGLGAREFAASQSMATTLAWSVIAGGILQAAILIPSVYAAGFWPQLRLARSGAAAGWRILRSTFPVAIGSSLLPLAGLANLWFASRLPQGSHSYLYLADRILELPLALIAVSVGSSILPGLARDWAAGDKELVGSDMTRALRWTVFLSLPNVIGMAALAGPIVDVLFVGREFSSGEGAATTLAIQAYAAALPMACLARVLAQGFYAARMAWYPAVTCLASLLCHLTLAFALSNVFGLTGLAAASAGSQAVFAALLALGFRSRIARFEKQGRLKQAARWGASSAVAVGVSQSYWFFLGHVGPHFPRSAALGATMLLTVAAYAVAAAACRAPEMSEAWSALTHSSSKRAF